MRLEEAHLTLGDIDLGEIDAESDAKLGSYFIDTPYVRSVFQGRQTLFLGRKGSGKSAVFTQLNNILSKHGLPTVYTVALTPDQYAWASLKAYKEQGIPSEQAHTNAWKLTLAIELAAHLISADHRWTGDEKKLISILRSFIETNFGTTLPDLRHTATSVLRNLSSFDLSAFGFGVGIGLNDPKKPGLQLTPAVITALYETIEPLTRSFPIVVALDRLDDSWDASDEAKSLLIGLLKAAKDINDRFQRDNAIWIRVLVFLRSDIYHSLEFDDKDKHRPTEQLISWDAKQLEEMVKKRLPEGTDVEDLFEEGLMRGNTKPFSYIIARTFLRPREVLQYLLECIQVAGEASTEISKKAIRTGERRYSLWKVADLKQEYKRVVPYFGEAIEVFRQEKQRYDRLGDLRSLIVQKMPQAVNRPGVNNVVNTLFEASVIGVRLSNAGSVKYRCEDADLALPAQCAVYVHQAVHKGLSIRETRRRSSGSDAAHRYNEISVQLWELMIRALPMQDLNWFNRHPKPEDVVECETFEACARQVGLIFELDSSEAALAAPNKIAPRRFINNRSSYETLRTSILQVLAEEGLAASEFLKLAQEHEGPASRT